MEDLNVQRSVSIEENTTNKMPTSEGNVDSVKEDHNAKTVSNSIEEKVSSSTEDKSSNSISENSTTITSTTPPNNEETKVTSTTEKDEKKEDVLLLSEPKEDRPHSPQNEDSSGRPKRDRKPPSLLQDFDSGDSLVGGRKSKVSPTSHSPPQSPIPLSQRRKKTTSSESTSELETTVEPTTNEQAANELVKLGSSFKEEENQNNNNEANEEQHKKSEAASSSEIGSPMRVDEPVENEVESKKRAFDESPTDGDRAPKKIRLKYDENAHMQKLEKELKEERQKRKQVEDENQNLKQEVKALRKQIAEQSKSSQGGSTVPVIQGFDSYITDERFRKAHQALLSLMKHKYGYVFNEPVEPAKFAIPDYFSVIKNPMDFGSIKRKLEGLAYSNLDEFAADVNLVFSNAKTYNPPGTDVHMMADTLEKIFEKKMPGIKAPSSPAPTVVPSTPPQVNLPTAQTPTAPASEEMAMMMKQISEMQANMNLMKQQFENLQQRKGPGRPPRVNSPLAASPPSPDYVAPSPRPGPGRPPAVERVKSEKKEKEKPVKVEKKVNKLSEEFLNSLPVKDKALITCHKIISSLMSHRYGYPFVQPVDPIRDGAHDYFNVIKHPMDFGTIHNKIETGSYDNVDDFIKDTNLVFKNAKTYNAMGSDVYVMADTLQKVFEKKMISEKLMEAPPQPTEVSRPAPVTPATPPPQAPKEVASVAPDSPPNVKKAEEVKAMASQINTIRESMKQVKEVIGELKTTGTTNAKPKPAASKPKKEVSQKAMSFEEKYELSQKLSELSPDQLGNVVQIIKEHQPNLVQEPTGEIEINLDILDTTTLRHLEKFVRDAQNKEKKKGSHAKNEGLFGSGSESDTSSESE